MNNESDSLKLYEIYIRNAEVYLKHFETNNHFFVSANILLFSLISFLFDDVSKIDASVFAVAILAILLNIFWCLIITSYQNLNSVKHEVLQDIEKTFLVKPLTEEWLRLNSQHKYLRLRAIYRFIPYTFISIYVLLLLVFVF